ncbi:MAG: DUF5317 domain-containing protein [Chloroflexi bacterium]|nr:DUF5317 domain-containing protein [Chloroflexota bacterium]
MGARWRLRFPDVELRLAGIVPAALAIQLIAIFADLGSDDLFRRVLFIASYLLLIVFVFANVRRPSVALFGVGVLLNFLPIIANGGLMPITPETLLKTGDVPEDARIGEWVSGTKDVLLERDDVHLYFFSDRLTSDLSPSRAFSIGDLVLIGGAMVLLLDLLLPRPYRATD